MRALPVIKADMRIERQESLSPFGLLTQVFTEELLRRNTQSLGNYRPLRLAYLEEEAEEAAPPPEIHFDLDVDLVVNRILKAEKAKDGEKGEKKSPSQRILERVILREKEIRTAYPETRRVEFRGGGRSISASLPLRPREEGKTPEQGRETVRMSGSEVRQPGEGRSTRMREALRPSAGLAQLPTALAFPKQESGRALSERTLPLASQAMSVPAAGGWTPTQREAHPGYPQRKTERMNASI